MSPEKLLIINPGWEQRELVAAAVRLGYKLYGLSTFGNTDRPSSEYDDWCSVHGLDFCRALEFARTVGVEAVVSTQCDYGLQMQAFLSEVLELPGPGLAQGQISANKFLQRRKMAEEGAVRQPDYALCYDLGTASSAMASMNGSVVIKPVDNRGSIGVSIVNDADELPTAVNSAVANSNSGLFLVEQRIHGEMFLVEGFGPLACAVGRKKMNREFAYMNDSIMFNAMGEDTQSQALARVHADVCSCFGFFSGQTSGEYIVNADGIWLVEATNRAGGVMIGSAVVRAITGIDPSLYLLKEYAGYSDSVDGSDARRQTCVLLRYLCFAPGPVTRISGDGAWVTEKGYIGHYWFVTPPIEIVPPSDALKRSGVLLTSGDSEAAASTTTERLLENLEIVYG